MPSAQRTLLAQTHHYASAIEKIVVIETVPAAGKDILVGANMFCRYHLTVQNIIHVPSKCNTVLFNSRVK